ncbi:type III secretion system export apparatus subunit SctT [Candidatus Pantoea multigeneris]|uniref:EscT/YscT/HrcT family type III secretion system export apparatus protein n=1 Tax=Candidatus Pantoea multigeneris TaxID=2608357 RepID=A0ABX0RD60_9GAMM|nr:type III secretion system export apparatus subunit SctT [Pantoea multigeneris]NIF23295.1 EscT/YscT/HrcT family type III secretion system export apparatus protein [Pantoea multigeneris]
MNVSYIDFVEIISGEIFFLAISMARVYAFMVFIPCFLFGLIKGKLKVSLVISVAIIITPLTKFHLSVDNLSIYDIASVVMAEMIKGVVIGVLVSLPFWIVESYGGLIDNQRGTLMGGQINTALGQDDFTPLGYFFKNLLGIIIIINFGFYFILEILMSSYSIWPINRTLPDLSAQKFEYWLQFLKNYISIIILYSAPVVVVLMLIDLASGILNILAPQAQVNMIAIPIKCLAGIFILIIMMLMYRDLMVELFFDFSKVIKYFVGGAQ